jgi:hypothetical protein
MDYSYSGKQRKPWQLSVFKIDEKLLHALSHRLGKNEDYKNI